VIGALQLVELLLTKAPTLYRPAFRREGVFHEIESLSERPLTTSKAKEKEKEKEPETPAPELVPPPIPVPTMPNLKKLSSLSLDPEDAITLRARVLKFKHMSDEQDHSEDDPFDRLRTLVEKFSSPTASESELSEALWELAQLFSSPHTTISSFELLQSGIVDGLLKFATDEGRLGIIHALLA
jgi:E3 ubiquitin-protein ligase TRIP12